MTEKNKDRVYRIIIVLLIIISAILVIGVLEFVAIHAKIWFIHTFFANQHVVIVR